MHVLVQRTCSTCPQDWKIHQLQTLGYSFQEIFMKKYQVQIKNSHGPLWTVTKETTLHKFLFSAKRLKIWCLWLTPKASKGTSKHVGFCTQTLIEKTWMKTSWTREKERENSSNCASTSLCCQFLVILLHAHIDVIQFNSIQFRLC